MAHDTEMLKELREEVEDERRGELVDAYLAEPKVESITTKALEVLAEKIDAIDQP